MGSVVLLTFCSGVAAVAALLPATNVNVMSASNFIICVAREGKRLVGIL
jgi:hypothetical protein